MANLAVSAVCNRRCAYCFALDHLGESDGAPFLPLDALPARLEFLDRSGIDEVRLLGGEPTLHPQFGELVRRVRAAGKRLVLFSNGLMPEEALRTLESLPPAECTVLVNVTPPDGDPEDRSLEQQRAAIVRLGDRAVLGVNIHRIDLDLGFLLPLVAESGCKRSIRAGMAQPCLSGTNRHIVPGQYRAVALMLLRFARGAAPAGVSIDLDCGFVRCMFDGVEIDELRALGSALHWRCSPILDIDLDGGVLHCFPLAGLGRVPLAPGTDAAALRRAFQERTRPYRQAGVFKECSSCAFKEAHAISRA